MHSTARLGAACLAALLATVSGLQAATIVVTNTDDDGPGSLRDAIAAASPGDRIEFDPPLAGSTIVLTTGMLVIDKDLVITGTATVDAAGIPTSAFLVEIGSTVALEHLNIIGSSGGFGTDGAGIRNEGSLTLNHMEIADGAAVTGGGISNGSSARLVLNDSTVRDNSSFFGGGIWNGGGTLILNRSAILDNTGGFRGGGISGLATLNNSTVSGNQSQFGGGIHGGAILSHSTITGNVASAGGGGVRSGPFVARNSILAGNSARNGPECLGVVESLGYNMVGSTQDCFGDWATGDRLNLSAAALLEAQAADNGGPTLTHALIPGSRAIDNIPLADCIDVDGDPVLTDQRGIARPQQGFCDSGAFELKPPIDPRSSGFWKHQCGGMGLTQVSPEDLATFLVDVGAASGAFAECASLGCAVLTPDPPQNKMRPKAERQLLALWLNVVSGRLPEETAIDLGPLSQAATVGEAIAQVESVLCDPIASRPDLETAKDIAESLNLGEDMEIVGPVLPVAARPGETASFTVAIVNMSPYDRSYDLTTSSAWPMRLSRQWVGELGSGQVSFVTADVDVPWWAGGRAARTQVIASDVAGGTGLIRDAVIALEVAPLPAGTPQRRPIVEEPE